MHWKREVRPTATAASLCLSLCFLTLFGCAGESGDATLVGKFVIDVEASLAAVPAAGRATTRFDATTRYEFLQDGTWTTTMTGGGSQFVIKGVWKRTGDEVEVQPQSVNGKEFAAPASRIFRDDGHWVYENISGDFVTRSYLKPDNGQ